MAGGDSHHNFSYSRLQTFKQCPAQYRFRYIDHLKASGQSIESFLGICQHQCLEWLYRERMTGHEVLFDQVLERYRAIWSAGWDQGIRIFRSTWSIDDYYQLGVRSLAGFYRQYAPFKEPVAGLEESLTFDLDGSGRYPMRAILDRLDHHGGGHWSIHDYKTGRRVLTPNQAQGDLQMKVYFQALLATREDVDQVDVVWHFLRHGLEVRLSRVGWNSKRIMGMLQKRIDQVREAEKRPETLEPNETVLCNWCYYWDYCQAKKGQAHPAREAV